MKLNIIIWERAFEFEDISTHLTERIVQSETHLLIKLNNIGLIVVSETPADIANLVIPDHQMNSFESGPPITYVSVVQ